MVQYTIIAASSNSKKRIVVIKKNKERKFCDAHQLTHLPPAVELVGEFDLGEVDGLLHPVGAEVGRVWVDVHTAGGCRLRLTARHPVAVHVLPSGERYEIIEIMIFYHY